MMERKGRPVTLTWDAKHLDQFDLPGVLPEPSSTLRAYARRSLMAGILMEATGEARPHYYPRRRNDYASAGKRYSGGLYTYANVVSEVDLLDEVGLIEHRRARPGPDTAYRSEFDPTPQLLAMLADAGVEAALDSIEVHEVIQVRNADKVPIDYPDTERTRRARNKLHRINEALGSATIVVHLTGGAWHGALFREGDYCINTACVQLVRIFNGGSFNLGGRFYNGFWQNMRKADRGLITLDGSSTVEPDYRCLHPSMLYALAGGRLGGDAYDIGPLPDGVTRAHVKRALNTLINADTRQKALGAIVYLDDFPGDYRQAADLAERIEDRHSTIACAFGSGVGRKLQNLDSQMAERVMLDLLNEGVVVLPIHDSFRCRAQDESRVLEAMERAKTDVLRSAA